MWTATVTLDDDSSSVGTTTTTWTDQTGLLPPFTFSRRVKTTVNEAKSFVAKAKAALAARNAKMAASAEKAEYLEGLLNA